MRDIDYVIGRLQGLNELVAVLREVGKKGGQNPEIIATLAEHISGQLESILKEFDSLDVKAKHKTALKELKGKHMPEAATPAQAKAARKAPGPAIKAAPAAKKALPEAKKPVPKKAAPKPEEEAPKEEPVEAKPATPAAVLEKHEKTVDDLLKELESMRSQ